jgi:hypothetical protein
MKIEEERQNIGKNQEILSSFINSKILQVLKIGKVNFVEIFFPLKKVLVRVIDIKHHRQSTLSNKSAVDETTWICIMFCLFLTIYFHEDLSPSKLLGSH